MVTDIEKIPESSWPIITDFLHEILDPWTGIEGAELADSQIALIKARGYDDEINLGLMLLLDRSIRTMYHSEWFQEDLKNEREPYDYYAQGVADAVAGFEAAREKFLGRARQFGGEYGGAEAELWILDYDPIVA